VPRSAHALLLAVLLVQAPAGVAAELLAPSSGPASTPSVSSARSLSLGTALRQALATNPGTQIRRQLPTKSLRHRTLLAVPII
jgi:hypothetical protein